MTTLVCWWNIYLFTSVSFGKVFTYVNAMKHNNPLIVAYWCHVVPWTFSYIDPGNVLLHDGTRSLPIQGWSVTSRILHLSPKGNSTAAIQGGFPPVPKHMNKVFVVLCSCFVFCWFDSNLTPNLHNNFASTRTIILMESFFVTKFILFEIRE